MQPIRILFEALFVAVLFSACFIGMLHTESFNHKVITIKEDR